MRQNKTMGVLIAIIFCVVITSSCAQSRRYDTDLPVFSTSPLILDLENHSVGRLKTQYIAMQLLKSLDDKSFLKENRRIAVLPFVDLEDLNSTTAFGQYICHWQHGI